MLLAALTLKRHERASVGVALNVDDVRRRVNVSQRLFAFDFNSSGNRTDLSYLPAGAQWITIGDSSTFSANHLRVCDFEFLIRVWKNRKDACLKQILAGVLEQSGIALAPYNLVVNAARFFAGPDFTDEPSITVPNRKLSY